MINFNKTLKNTIKNAEYSDLIVEMIEKIHDCLYYNNGNVEDIEYEYEFEYTQLSKEAIVTVNYYCHKENENLFVINRSSSISNGKGILLLEKTPFYFKIINNEIGLYKDFYTEIVDNEHCDLFCEQFKLEEDIPYGLLNALNDLYVRKEDQYLRLYYNEFERSIFGEYPCGKQTSTDLTTLFCDFYDNYTPKELMNCNLNEESIRFEIKIDENHERYRERFSILSKNIDEGIITLPSFIKQTDDNMVITYNAEKNILEFSFGKNFKNKEDAIIPFKRMLKPSLILELQKRGYNLNTLKVQIEEYKD